MSHQRERALRRAPRAARCLSAASVVMELSGPPRDRHRLCHRPHGRPPGAPPVCTISAKRRGNQAPSLHITCAPSEG
ncbi:hypothetical protein NDU88_008095 [Pleurodeles waltl]|uniref:Uncharacterized protein n=1 Tax=Pleurodeles waltl TaxID=8319 RepID=A0AAV7SUN7_PLEWA|nr:hypothetical protein NDU88_008095 [Pleurodeles waltl]